MKKFLLFICLAGSLSAEVNVLALAGSTRRDSYNKQLMTEASQIAEKMGAKVTVFDLKEYPMPIYDADLEEEHGIATNAKKLRELMIRSDAIIIASPEYNSSVSPVLVNALAWASRNDEGPSRDAFKGKKFAIMSASPGGGGGRRGLVHLQAIIQDVGGTVVPTKVSIPRAYEYFSNKNRPVNPELKQEIKELLQ